MTICGIASSGQEGLTQLALVRPDVVLVDLKLPDIDGVELIGILRLLYPELPVIVLSTYRDTIDVQRALAAGAQGYVVKGDPLEIEKAIRCVIGGELYLSPEILAFWDEPIPISVID